MRNVVADAESTVQVIMERRDLCRIALNKLFGISYYPKLVPGARGIQRVIQGEALPEATPAFDGLREAYVTMTGDTDLLRVGAAGASDFPSALANTLNHLMLFKDYATEYHWQDLVTSYSSPSNFKPQVKSRVRYVEDLPDLGDDAPVDEIVSHGDEGITYSVNQKAATLTITRRMLLADQTETVQRLIEQLGRAARRTLAKRVWAKLINNDTYGVDGLPIFDAAHGNLGSAALSVAALTAARVAMFAQKEPGSNERLGIGGGPLLLAIPIELEATALPINTCEYIPGSTTYEGNPWKGRFGPNNERIFANPLMAADANDWMLFDVSGNVGIIEVGFLMGQQNPQIILASDQREGQGLSQDRIVYKIRHEYECAIADYRGAYKAVVT